ncbi:MAG: hypothetical protein H6708_27670 [Kofleriaceae bacterium]|nr:hypothetical protein [Myxococcales bacterium]MCB9564187.1 hypothetical protein [Kofleriaceae bacterium]
MLAAEALQTACPSCWCVEVTSEHRCNAIQDLVRPDDVIHLFRRPLRHPVIQHALANRVAGWMQRAFRRGALRYIPDPEGCDMWCPPALTLQRRGGDCDDLAILAASVVLAGGGDCDVIVGHFCDGRGCQGHAWVEGVDERGAFLLEATTGALYRDQVPAGYISHLILRPGVCAVAA